MATEKEKQNNVIEYVLSRRDSVDDGVQEAQRAFAGYVEESD